MLTVWIGCIINVASLLGLKGGKGSAAYAASKAGVVGTLTSKFLKTIIDEHIGLTRALAAELGEKNIRVNVLIPGYIETDMTDGTFSFSIVSITYRSSRS
jgi:NAD(P)-dependent dehydrogenase (short-subunit alcohol dehydrogenase family)